MAGIIRIERSPRIQCLVRSEEDYTWSLTQALASDPHDIRSVYKESGKTGITEVRTNRLAGAMYESRREWPIEE